jgi:hypothetical protein
MKDSLFIRQEAMGFRFSCLLFVAFLAVAVAFAPEPEMPPQEEVETNWSSFGHHQVARHHQEKQRPEVVGVWETSIHEATFWGNLNITHVKNSVSKGAFAAKISAHGSLFLAKIMGAAKLGHPIQASVDHRMMRLQQAKPLVRARRQAVPGAAPADAGTTSTDKKEPIGDFFKKLGKGIEDAMKKVGGAISKVFNGNKGANGQAAPAGDSSQASPSALPAGMPAPPSG